MKQSTFSAVMANSIKNLLQGCSKSIRLLLVMFLTLTASTAWAEDATLSFANKAQRTSFSTTKQVWEQNGVTFTNDKSSSTNAVADYANPVCLYANSSVTVACSLGNMTKIVFDCNSSNYATAMKNSIGSSATASSDKVTVTLDGSSTTFTVAKLTAQVRLDKITVTYETVASYTVTYNVNGGSGTMNNSTGSSISLKECTFTAPSGKEFKEWNTNASGNGISYQPGDIVTESLDLYAIWQELPRYIVTLEAGPGTCAASVTETSAGKGVTLPTPTLDGCDDWEFAG